MAKEEFIQLVEENVLENLLERCVGNKVKIIENTKSKDLTPCGLKIRIQGKEKEEVPVIYLELFFDEYLLEGIKIMEDTGSIVRIMIVCTPNSPILKSG